MVVMAVALESMRRYIMANTTFGEDPEDWVPEEESVSSDPLTVEEIDDKWIQFYTDRIHTQIENFLSQDE